MPCSCRRGETEDGFPFRLFHVIFARLSPTYFTPTPSQKTFLCLLIAALAGNCYEVQNQIANFFGSNKVE